MKTLESTKNYYNAIARGYPELYHQEQIEKINLIKSYIPKKGNLLDLGAGSGVLNPFISSEINLISFDLSQELLNLNPNFKENKIQGDICNLPFENNSIGNIISLTVIQDVYDIEKALSEINRVLSSKGLLIISFLKLSQNKEFLLKHFKEKYTLIKEIEEKKDIILILKNSI